MAPRGRPAGGPPRQPGRRAPSPPTARRRLGASRESTLEQLGMDAARGAYTATPVTSRATQRGRFPLAELRLGAACRRGERVELLGQPVVELAVASDQPLGFVMARLCDVAPDGVSTVITRGALEPLHLDGRAAPRARSRRARRLTPRSRSRRSGTRWRRATGCASRCPRATGPGCGPITRHHSHGKNGRRGRLPARAPRPEADERVGFGPPETAAPLVDGGPHAAPPAARDRARRRDRPSVRSRWPAPSAAEHQRPRSPRRGPGHLLDRRGRPTLGPCRSAGTSSRGGRAGRRRSTSRR